MTYQAYVPQPQHPPRKPHKGLVAALVALGVALVALCCVGAVTTLAKRAEKADSGLSVAAPPAEIGESTTTAAPTSAPAGKLTATNVKLTVKTTSKQCFDSAGCLVEWTIRASVPVGTKVAGACDVTYDVHGLTETQTHTLTVKDDLTYEQDPFQSGQTSGSSKKLSAKVTEVECG